MTPIESPIEWMFANAIREVGQYDIHFLLPSSLPDFVGVLDDQMLCHKPFFGAPQVTCGRVRVDFMFMLRDYDEHAIPPLLAVECDGHDFHEKTKEQAARDKARDRFLTQVGCHVMRFAGSEVAKNPRDCAQEVMDWLISREERSFDSWAARQMEFNRRVGHEQQSNS
jgi:very-short-patch-repair endonuclease